MKLYLISQNVETGYDTYDSAVVCQPDEESARNTDPSGGMMTEERWRRNHGVWCNRPQDVTVQYLGEADPNIDSGVVCASFNAG